jgi:2'-5' RNA ligase
MEVVEEKQFEAKVENRTVVDTPSLQERQTPRSNSFVLQIAQAAQSVVPWGQNFLTRDQQLRSFWHSESWLSSVVYSVTIRNASFAWEILGSNPEKPQPKNTVNAVTKILNNSNRGKGWKHLIIQTCIDLYTQDNGAFWEIIRTKQSPNAPVINISHLDAGRCIRTGNPKFPVIYTDRHGVETPLPYWRVKTIEELPSPIENAYGLQYCAVSRALMAAEIIQSIATYKLEKVSGNFTKSIDVVSGLTKTEIDDAIALAEEQNLNKGLYRFSLPVLIPGIDPTTSLSHVHIDLASLPDNFDEDTSFKWYVAQLAAAFGVDYQEIAPLMTGNLGSSQQSDILHLKTRGKGPALIMGLFEDLINSLLPSNVIFKFLEQDIRSETEKAEAQFTRIKARSMQIKAGELTAKAAREIAVMAGDLPRWLKDDVDRAEKEQEKFNREQQRDEFGPTQLDEGVETETGGTRLNMAGVKQLQKVISTHPYDIMQRWKASIGNPGGTLIAPVWFFGRDDIKKLRADLMAQWQFKRARFIASVDYHVTLVHSSLLDKSDAEIAGNRLTDVFDRFPFKGSSSKLSSFNTPNGKAIILLVDDIPALRLAQQEMYTTLEELNVPLSEFSKPEDWIPHITLAYVDNDVEFSERDIEPIFFDIEWPKFTRSEFRTDTDLDY